MTIGSETKPTTGTITAGPGRTRTKWPTCDAAAMPTSHQVKSAIRIALDFAGLRGSGPELRASSAAGVFYLIRAAAPG